MTNIKREAKEAGGLGIVGSFGFFAKAVSRCSWIQPLVSQGIDRGNTGVKSMKKLMFAAAACAAVFGLEAVESNIVGY